MKTCVVIGGGFAGLAAAVRLSKYGIKVTLLESSGKLGGRAYSLTDKESGSIIDNGQHIMMGCYDYTLNFFETIGASSNLDIQKRLSINFVNKGGEILPLKASGGLYPFNLLNGILNYKALNSKERRQLTALLIKVFFTDTDDLKEMTVKEWLLSEGQSENTLKAFWEILAAGTLNTSMDKASAALFARILKQMFFRGNKAASVVIPKTGLSEAYCAAAADYITAREGSVHLSESVEGIEITDGKAVKLATSKRRLTGFDYLISAVPHHAFTKFGGAVIPNGFNPEYSLILTVHIWLNNNALKEKFYGFIGSPVHWVFNHDKHITLVISDGNMYNGMQKEEIFNLAAAELKSFLNIDASDIKNYKVIKEKRATFVPSNDIIDRRPTAKTRISNLFLAGDWTDTQLPATIEGAVKSGYTAAGRVLKLA